MTDEALTEALDGLYAYDSGCVDSGTHDEALRARCIAELHNRMGEYEIAPRLFLSRLVRDMWLSEEALANGYGIQDAMEFVAWLDERMDIHIP